MEQFSDFFAVRMRKSFCIKKRGKWQNWLVITNFRRKNGETYHFGREHFGEKDKEALIIFVHDEEKLKR